jgi:RND family efflux transporter MFP subunit
MDSKRARTAVLLVAGLYATAPAVAQGPPPAAPVEVESVKEEEFTPTAFVLGVTEPRRQSVVAASIEGYVVDYPVDEGMRVVEGTVLARLRDEILRLRLNEAEAALREIREQHKNAQRDLERARKLIATGAVTEKDLDARSTREKTVALRIPQGEAKIEILKADISKKTVTAPFAGQIVTEHTELGEWITRGGPVVTLVDISSLLVRVNVPERHVRFLEETDTVKLWVRAAGGKPFVGKVVSISDAGDPTSNTFTVRVEVARRGELRAGMSARVEIPAGEPQKALVVSKDAILLRGTKSFVFVMGEGGRAERRDVETGRSSGSLFAVLQGVRAGEQVVVKGNERIQPGMPLRVVEHPSAVREASESD